MNAVEEPQSPRLKTASQIRSLTSSMLLVFSDIRGVVQRLSVHQVQTVNAQQWRTAHGDIQV